MGDIQFGDNRGTFNRFPQQSAGGITGWLIKKGIASNRRTAEYIQIGIIAIAVLVTIVAWNWGGGGGNANVPAPALVDQQFVPAGQLPQ